MRLFVKWLALALGPALLLACASPPPPPLAPAQPEAASGWTAKPGWATRHFAVAAANPQAVEAGYQILKAGGNALDAAIATQLVLALVEPQSSGIGGGAFLMHWDGRNLSAWDGRETAPAAVDERLFIKPDGRPMSMGEAVVGGRAVGTPGVLAMLEAAHRRHGRLPWARLFEPAIALSEQGFEVGARMHLLLGGASGLRRDAVAARYFFDADGKPWPQGQRLRNPALAEVLRRIAAEGSEQAFYRGSVARDMVRRVRGHAGNPGLLSEADLAAYRPRERQPLCTDWRRDAPAGAGPGWRVCGFPPPSSGHLTVMQILAMLPPGDAARDLQDGKPRAAWLHRYLEASRLAFADRAQYIADPDFVGAPAGDWASLLDPDYLRQRAALIGPRSMGEAQAGTPRQARSAHAPQAAQVEHGTSHISVIDGEGHAVALTTTVEAAFGAQIMSDGGTGLVGGFVLNNQLTDFSMLPRDAQGRPVANRVEPGKRPRSSMSPTLVFDPRDGRLLMSLGSPGGQAIIHFVAKTLLATQDWGMDVQSAINLPNVGNFNGPSVLERGLLPPATVQGLRALGHQVIELDFPSGLQAIERRGSGWFGGADPRREGIVKGD